MNADRWHTVEQIGNHTYRIDECGVANAYLLVGESRALLIDTGNGIGNISRTVCALTSLPLTVTLTHHHCDHAGGVGFFDGAYVHEEDLSLIYTVSSCKLSSRWLCSLHKEKYEFPAQPHRPHLFPMHDGHVFELGGRSVTVVHTPGHTRGSVTFLDDVTRFMFTGDVVGPQLWLWLPGSCTVEAWLPTARKLYALSETYTPYWGHQQGRQSRDQLARTVSLGEELLRRTNRNAFPGKTACYPDKDAEICILYRTSRVRS